MASADFSASSMRDMRRQACSSETGRSWPVTTKRFTLGSHAPHGRPSDSLIVTTLDEGVGSGER